MRIPFKYSGPVAAFIVFHSWLIAPARAADPNSQITIYPKQDSVYYAEKAGEKDCTLGMDGPIKARVIEETDTDIHVDLGDSIQGCSLGIPWISRDSRQGWIPKSQIRYSGKEDDTADLKTKVLPVRQSPDEPLMKAAEPDCPPTASGAPDIDAQGASDLGDLVNQMNARGSGMKTIAETNEYLSCYPRFADSEKNFKKFEPYMNEITNSFNIGYRNQTLIVQPAMFRCLLRRESGFSPNNLSGASGLGQHTPINIKHINSRISNPKTWESKIWNRFFDSIRGDRKAQAMLAACNKDKNGRPRRLPRYPTFNSRADAACPLQSLAASAIYNLEIQQALLQNSKVQKIDWKKDLEYQLAIGAAYNLGDSAAGDAVEHLMTDGWIDAIQKKSKDDDKRKEVRNQVTALRNCMEAGNHSPMYYKSETQRDFPVCDAYKTEARPKK